MTNPYKSPKHSSNPAATYGVLPLWFWPLAFTPLGITTLCVLQLDFQWLGIVFTYIPLALYSAAVCAATMLREDGLGKEPSRVMMAVTTLCFLVLQLILFAMFFWGGCLYSYKYS